MNLVNIPTRVTPSPAPPTPSSEVDSTQSAKESEDNAVGVFTAPQAVITFPVAASLITVAWKVLGQVNAPLGNNKWVPLVLGLVAGMLIYAQTVKPPRRTVTDKVAGLFFALLNSLSLAATALGIDTAIPGS